MIFKIHLFIGNILQLFVVLIIYQIDILYLTNSFRGQHFKCVTDLTLYDTRPFEHDFFEWISREFPFLKYLNVNNLTPQKKTCQIEKEISSKMSYLHLIQLELTDVHSDYADQFLHEKYAYIPRFRTLTMQYEQLDTLTNNFTNPAIRRNCIQLNHLIFNKSLVYPKYLSSYLKRKDC
jgi:hypothetical protein